MLTHALLKSRQLIFTMAIGLVAAGIATTASARSGDTSPSASSVVATSPSGSATETANGDAGVADPNSPVLSELNDLKEAVEAQTKQFAEHTRELESERAALHEEMEAIGKLEAKLGVLASGAVTPALSAAQPPIGGAPASDAQQNLQGNQPINVVTVEHPLSVKIGGADFTPGGFVDLTGIFRTTNDGTSGLSTNLPSIPFNNTLPAGALSEFRFTSQGSRLSLKVDANLPHSTAITGYIESDFNGYEPANADSSTKSDSFRLRVVWAQVRHGKWEVVTGQTWSLLTPTRVGISPVSENVFTALRLDSSYLAGMVYTRQPGVRFVYHPAAWAAFAVSLENPDQFVPTSVVFPTNGNPNFFSTQFDNGSSNTSATSAATNVAAPNLHPDIVAKTALDWKLGGKAFHVDLGAIARSFKDYSNLVTPHATDTITEGAGQANVNFEVARNFHLIGNSFYGAGGGRYIGALGPDVIVKPDGSLSRVRSGSVVLGYEWQTTPKLIIDSYYSGAYFWRNYQMTTSALGAPCGAPSTYCVGFGFPGSANTNNKDYQEASFGFIPTIWSSPSYGKLQFITQFSYVVRAPWYVPTGSPKNAHTFISFVNLRYIIP